jgi:transcriptional regulator with GAF, ATPase, and Fis domain
VTGWDSLHGKTLTRHRKRSRSNAQRVRASLHVVFPAECAASIALDEDRVIIGRNPAPDVIPRLRHPTVSRQHVELVRNRASGTYALRDLDSHNGSALNGVGVRGDAVELADGDVVRIGDVLCVFELATDTVDPAEVSRDAVPGASAAAIELRAAVARAARDPSPVLITGATGTGKERVAHELHRLSGRSGALVVLNCAAVPPMVFESQLFGHEKGAFTGATAAQPGMFRAAANGTLFLDEIGEMPSELQPKLLRAIQEGEVVPVGSSRAERVDVRVIAATNRDLDAEVVRGAFRRDLRARLVWHVHVPALAERTADLLWWFHRLYRAWLDHRPDRPRNELSLDAEAAHALLLAAWPDNLRGLDRLVHELATRTNVGDVEVSELPGWIHPAGSEPPAAARPPPPTREQLIAFFAEHGFNVRAAAMHFQRDRRQIYRWIESYGIERPTTE